MTEKEMKDNITLWGIEDTTSGILLEVCRNKNQAIRLASTASIFKPVKLLAHIVEDE